MRSILWCSLALSALVGSGAQAGEFSCDTTRDAKTAIHVEGKARKGSAEVTRLTDVAVRIGDAARTYSKIDKDPDYAPRVYRESNRFFLNPALDIPGAVSPIDWEAGYFDVVSALILPKHLPMQPPSMAASFSAIAVESVYCGRECGSIRYLDLDCVLK